MLGLVAVRVFVPGVADGLGNLRGIHRMDFGQIAVQDYSSREQERARIILVDGRIVSVRQVVPHAPAEREPILIEAGDCENVWNVDLLDELSRVQDQLPEEPDS